MSEMVAKMDDLGRPAWLALMVLGFIVFWPIGLATLAFLIWSGRMGCGWNGSSEDQRTRWERKMARLQDKIDRWGGRRDRGYATAAMAPTGNRAFDEYRSETLKRLEEEAHEFKSFLERLRHAKDKSEFDQFMTERRNRPAGEPPARDSDVTPPR